MVHLGLVMWCAPGVWCVITSLQKCTQAVWPVHSNILLTYRLSLLPLSYTGPYPSISYCALGVSSPPAELHSSRWLLILYNTAVFVFFCYTRAGPASAPQQQQRRAHRLAVMTTVSSSLNLGMYLSPRVISASFRGLKRHITLTPHSAASAMAAAAAAAGTGCTTPLNDTATNATGWKTDDWTRKGGAQNEV